MKDFSPQMLFDFKRALGDGDWFTCHLFRLMLKADEINLSKLAQVYPEHAEVVRAFRRGDLEGKV